MCPQLKYLFLVLWGIPLVSVFSQPIPCDVTNPEMTSTCQEACIICDIDGFTGRHESSEAGILPSDFCTFIVHNAQWIAFQAASTNVRIELSVSNCDMGSGLEMAIYKSLDCSTFEMISACRGGTNPVPQGSSAVFENTEPLVLGQYYYLAMDGNFGDNCDWTFTVLEGSTELDPLTVTAPIQGVLETCPNLTQRYETVPEQGAILFDWTLNDQIISEDTIPYVELSFENTGLYTLCVTAKNACDEAQPTCTTINVRIIPPNIIYDTFCAEDCYVFDGNTYCETGAYEHPYITPNGCDSLVVLELIRLEQAVNNLAFTICEGDTIYIGPSPYFTAGTFTETLQTVENCDSIVNLELGLIICNIQSDFVSSSTICYGGSDGMLNFSIASGTPPFTYNWQHLQSGLTGNGTITDLNQNTLIEGLPAGEIIIRIDDEFDNSDVIIGTISEPDPIQIIAELSNYNGNNISCFSASDGSVELFVSGGQAPYSYAWNNDNTSSSLVNVSAGNYIVNLIDNLGCERSQEITLSEPGPIETVASFIDPSCAGLETGQIVVQQSTGGVSPYFYAVDGNDFGDLENFEALGAGNYSLATQDANGCVVEQTGSLIAPDIPSLGGATAYSTPLGCEIQLEVLLNNSVLQSIQWTPADSLSCLDCLTPVLLPTQSDSYTILVESIDGCQDSLQISVAVEKLRGFYAPNAFSPNDDGFNDTFFLFGSKEVARIDLYVFNRWGSPIFEAIQMESIDQTKAWDGTYLGKKVEPGTYAWMAKIYFIDGFTDYYSGDINLIR